ncbi:hypothetical protein G9A89_013424 [Geosiphon pyriformis]|nr:hypothetical protein G9A89_013424 [Geosiphon pyriformis]
MSSTSPSDWLEGAFIVIEKGLGIFLDHDYSKVADLVKKYLEHNQKTPKEFFDCLNNKTTKRSVDYVLLGFSLEHGIGTIPNLGQAFLKFQKAANTENSFGKYFLGYCYFNGIGTLQDKGKEFELYSEAAEEGNSNAQYKLGCCYQYDWEQRKIRKRHLNGKDGTFICTIRTWMRLSIWIGPRRAFKHFLKAAETGNLNAKYELGCCYHYGWGTTKNQAKAFDLYSKLAKNSVWRSEHLKRFNLKFQNRSFNSIEQFLFEIILDQLTDEFKCLKCGNSTIMFPSSTICLFCDANNILNADLPKCPECCCSLKNPFWCASCELSRFSKTWGTWTSGNSKVDQYIEYTQRISESRRGYLEWISLNEIISSKVIGKGGFSVGKEGTSERGKILFWDKKNQKHKRSGITKVALKCLENSQDMEYISPSEFVALLNCASCRYNLECYGITKDITTNEFVMVLPFAEHGDLKAFLKVNENTLSWGMFLDILFQIVGGLRFIHDSKLVHGDLHPGNILVLKLNPLNVVLSDLGLCSPEICNGAPHSKDSDIYSFAIISWEIISGERPWNDYPEACHVHLDEMIEKNWDHKPYLRDTAKQLQQRVIAARDKCNLNEPVREKRLNFEEIQDATQDATRFRSRSISKPGSSTDKPFIY